MRSRFNTKIAEKIDLHQYAREGQSTADALIYLRYSLFKRLQYVVRIFFADLSKGFDLTDHNILFREPSIIH